MRPTGPEGRSHETLMAVIRTHIHKGEPVGSRAVSRQRKDSLSPASIRNLMLELEEEGYLEQPHTSAGRVPTDKAYRYYASQCDANQPPGKADENLILAYSYRHCHYRASCLTPPAVPESYPEILARHDRDG